MISSRESVRGFYKKPFWLPAFHYYSLALLLSFLLFIFSMLILYEINDKPFLVAGSLSVVWMITAFVFREFFLRRSRNAFLRAQRRLDENLRVFAAQNTRRKRLTLEQNSFFIKQIERKSEAAKVLADLSEAHRVVFEDCNKYLDLVEKELEEVPAGSTYLAAILKGKRKIERIRKYHLLAWAELEAQNLMNSLKRLKKTSNKLRVAFQTLKGLKVALSYYPNEAKLAESTRAVEELIVSIKVSSYIKRANRASSQKRYEMAVDYYQNALTVLEQSKSIEKQVLIEKINQEIQRLIEESRKQGRGDQSEVS